jgi:pyrroline-5-carboxylate reductase
MPELTVGVIGVGHFGTALIKGMLSHSNQVQILLTERDSPKLIADEYIHRISGSSVKGIGDIKSLKQNSDVIILCVRPQNMGEVMKNLIDYDKLVISFAAGLPISYYEEIKPDIKLIRAMSNLAIEYGKGVNGWVKNKHCKISDESSYHKIFNNLAYSFQYKQDEESNLDTITAISGSGIAYLAQVFDTVKVCGMDNGLSDRNSEVIIQKTVEGVLSLMENTDFKLNEIVKMVASKGGTTEVGIETMEKAGLQEALTEGLTETIEKCRQIRK